MKSPPLPTLLFYAIHQVVPEQGTAPGWWEQKVAVLLRMPGRGDVLGLPGGEIECRQNSQGKSKHEVHQNRLEGLATKLADADG